MQRLSFAFVIILLLAHPGSRQQACAEKSDAGKITPEIVNAPERWLDFSMATPYPMAVRIDGRRAVVKAGCEVVLYDLDSGKRLHAWTEQFSVVRFIGNGRFLWIVHGDHIAVWDAEKFREVQRFTAQSPAWSFSHRDGIDFAVSDDDEVVAIANRRNSFDPDLPKAVLVFDVRAGKLQQTLTTPEKAEVASLAFSPRSRRLLVRYMAMARSADRPASFHMLWDAEKGARICELPFQGQCRVSADGRWIAGTIADTSSDAAQEPPPASRKLDICEMETGKTIRRLEYAGLLHDFTFSPNSKKILAALASQNRLDNRTGDGGQLIEWDVSSGKRLFVSEDSSNPYASVAYSPDGQRRFATTEEPNGMDDDVTHYLCGWNVKTGAKLPIATYEFGSGNGAKDVFFYPNGDRFIDLNARFEVRETMTGKVVQTFPEYRLPTTQVAFMPDGERFLTRGWWKGPSYLTDCTSGRQREWYLPGAAFEFVDHGRLLYVDDSGPSLIDVVSNRKVLHFPVGGSCVAVSPDAKHALISVESPLTEMARRRAASRLVLFKTSQPGRPRVLEKYASVVAFRPDGTRFLAASDQAIEECDTVTGDKIRALWVPPGRPLAAAYSPDGTKVLACGVEGHADRRKPIMPWEPAKPGELGWAMLWDAATNRVTPLEGHTGPVTSVAFGPKGTLAATASLDKTIRLWNTKTGHAICVFQGHLGAISHIAYSPRGDRILSAAADGSALWNVERFATQPVAPVRLAKSFAPVERLDVKNVGLGVSDQPTGQFPLPSDDHRPAPPRFRGGAEWTLIEAGRIKRGELSAEVQAWLSQARTREWFDAPQSAKPAPTRNEGQLEGASLDGHHKLFLSRNRRTLVVRDNEDRVLQAWEGVFACVTISPSGDEVAAVQDVTAEGDQKKLTVYDVGAGRVQRTSRDADLQHLGQIAIDPKKRTLLTAGTRTITLRDYKTLTTIGKVQGDYSVKAAYAPQGQFVAVNAHLEPEIRLYDPVTLAMAKTIPISFPARWFRFSPDGKRLLVGQEFAGQCELLTMVDVDSGRQLWSQSVPSDRPAGFSADGLRVLSYSGGWSPNVAILLDAMGGEVLCVVRTSGETDIEPVLGHDGASIHLGTPAGPRVWPTR